MKVMKTNILILSNIFVIAELLPFSKFFFSFLLHCKPMEACDLNIPRTT